jgi:hypothetical protein
LLKAHGLVVPCPTTIQGASGEQQVDGLYCINEEALDALSDAAFLELRAVRGLTIAFWAPRIIALLTDVCESHS